MAQHFLLPCECGKVNEVSATQAGAVLTCQCGRENRVPNLAALRRFTPSHADESAQGVTKAPWRKRSVVLILTSVALTFAGMILGLLFWNGYHFRTAQESCDSREFGRADDHLHRRLSFGLGDFEAELLGVQIARRSGDTEAAAKRLKRCHRFFGSNARVMREERLLALQQGDLQEAAQLLASEAAQPESPETPWVLEAYIIGSLRQLSSAYSQNQTFEGSDARKQLLDTQRAIEQWMRLRPQRSDQVQGLVWRFQSHLFSHSLALARSDVDRALALDPNHRDARVMLAIYLSQEHLDESALQWQQLHEGHPDDIDIMLNLADIRRRLGQLEAAEALLDQLLAQDGSNVLALVNRGLVAQDLRDLASAEEWFRHACREDPDSLEANLALSRCLRAAGKVQEADHFQDKVNRIQGQRKRQREAVVSSAPSEGIARVRTSNTTSTTQ
jgi:Tfp pilus assembly protein PilF